MKKSDMLKHFEEFMDSLSDEEFFEVFEKEFGAIYEDIPQFENQKFMTLDCDQVDAMAGELMKNNASFDFGCNDTDYKVA